MYDKGIGSVRCSLGNFSVTGRKAMYLVALEGQRKPTDKGGPTDGMPTSGSRQTEDATKPTA